MKKLILVGVGVAACMVAIMFMRDRFGIAMFSPSELHGDLIVVNDSPATISTEYKKGGKEIVQELPATGQATGGQGFMRVFTAKKSGSYELTYPFPRPAGSPLKIGLSQIIAAANNENFGDEIITKKGMIGDISVEYEEVRQLDSTY